MDRAIYAMLGLSSGHGVIYFHADKTGRTMMRICQLPRPIPRLKHLDITLDITAVHAICDWSGTTIKSSRKT